MSRQETEEFGLAREDREESENCGRSGAAIPRLQCQENRRLIFLVSAFLFWGRRGSSATDWWGQFASNELAGCFTAQPLKWLVNNTSGPVTSCRQSVFSEAFLGGRRHHAAWPAGLCSGIGGPTRSCSSVKRSWGGGAASRPPQLRYDAGLFNLTHLRGGNE